MSAWVAVPDPSMDHQLALADAGAAMVSQGEVVDDLKKRRWEPEPFQLYALHPSRLAASPKVRVLLKSSANNVMASTHPGASNRSELDKHSPTLSLRHTKR